MGKKASNPAPDRPKPPPPPAPPGSGRDLLDDLRLCSQKKLIVSYKPMIRVSTVCRKALTEIERLRAEVQGLRDELRED